jgi:hypothetical protein
LVQINPEIYHSGEVDRYNKNKTSSNYCRQKISSNSIQTVLLKNPGFRRNWMNAALNWKEDNGLRNTS